MRTTRSAKSFGLGLVLAGLLVPSAAMAQDLRPSVAQQIKLGQDAKADILKKEKALPSSDPRVVEVRRIGRRIVEMIPTADRKKRPFQYSFDVIDSKDVNAFALPGGPVFMYTGLLDKLKTEDELAGILAHEVTHVQNQHWASAYADNQKRQLGIGLLLGVFGIGRTGTQIAGLVDTLAFSLPYSRKHEIEADDKGFDYMVKAGYNPNGMADVFELLAKEGGGGSGAEWLSTHPDNSRRVREIRERIAKSKRTYPAEKRRANYRPQAAAQDSSKKD